MCGIFAALSLSGPIREDYSRALAMMSHRGPDGSGIQRVSLLTGPDDDRSDRAWLGHRRLSIIDTSELGAQPMSSADGRYVIIFNGEIYNFLELRADCVAAGATFHTGSDTEVLLACWSLWGENALDRLIGMYAFVLIDRFDGVGWLARDPLGIKPLHYAVAGDRLLISSEIGPIMSTGRIPLETDALQSLEYIRFGASNAIEETLIKGVKRLAPGAHMSFDFRTRRLSVPRFRWSPSERRRKISFADAVDECRSRFLNSVRLHLRSDVPIGAALSGGIDSSAIVCAIRDIEPDLELNTFSFISADPAQSEERWVDIVNRHVGAKAHKIVPQVHELGDDLEDLLKAQGEPFASASVYAQMRVFRMARRAGVPVTLDGQGADELLAGYLPYLGTVGAGYARTGRFDRLARLVWAGGNSTKERAKLFGQVAQSLTPPSFRTGFRQMIGRRILPDFMDGEWFADQGVYEADVANEAIGSYANLRDHLVDTATRTSLPTLLRIADRSAMSQSVESRVPFLTKDFVDFLVELPPDYLVSRDGMRKHVFREAISGLVPDEIRLRKDKVGFFADDAIWLRANRERFMQFSGHISQAPQFKTRETLAFVHAFFSGEHQAASQVWRIFVYSIWYSQMRSLVDGGALGSQAHISDAA